NAANVTKGVAITTAHPALRNRARIGRPMKQSTARMISRAVELRLHEWVGTRHTPQNASVSPIANLTQRAIATPCELQAEAGSIPDLAGATSRETNLPESLLRTTSSPAAPTESA